VSDWPFNYWSTDYRNTSTDGHEGDIRRENEPVMPGSQEKRSQDILDDLAIKVAKMHYEEALEPSEIARQLKKEGIRDARDARVLIQRARDRKLASVKVEPTLTSPRDFGLEEELQALTGIRRCLVAKTKLAVTSENLDSDDPDERRRAQQDNGDLHRQLGEIAGEYLWAHLRPGDCIAVGGGRATWFTVQTVRKKRERQKKPLYLGDARVVSLAGGVLMGPAWESVPTVDADLVARELGRALEIKTVNLVELQATAGALPDKIVEEIAPQIQGGAWPGQRIPDMALFGMGMLSDDYYILKSPGALADQVEIWKDELQRNAKRSVADICQHFWAIEGAVQDVSIQKRIRDFVRNLNDNILHIEFSKLDQAREKVLIAGGAPKRKAVLQLLAQAPDQPGDQAREHLGLHITVLVTDECMARQLIEDLSDSRGTPER